MLTSLDMFICCFRFVYSVWSVSLHLGPGGLPPACIQFVLERKCVLFLHTLLASAELALVTLGLRFGKLHRLCLVSFYFKVIKFHVARSELLLFCYGELACNGMM